MRISISHTLREFIWRFESQMKRKPLAIYVTLDEWVELSRERGCPDSPIVIFEGVPLKLKPFSSMA